MVIEDRVNRDEVIKVLQNRHDWLKKLLKKALDGDDIRTYDFYNGAVYAINEAIIEIRKAEL